MKKVLTMMMLCTAMTVQAQWYNGWSEKAGLVFSLHVTDSMPELYSPMQSSDPLPVSQCSRRGDTLNMECKSIGFKITLVEQGDTWVGTWRQGVIRETIVLEKADGIYQMSRPQTPQPPYRFEEETVVADYVDSKGNEVHLEGTLTYPQGKGRYPCVVMVSGSGQQNRDEELFHHKPFLVLADYLASRGIAMLRYDDRGVGDSRGAIDSADTRLFAEDAEAMFRAVRKNKHVDRQRLGMGGHSEGGAIAPMVAARNEDVKFVVMLAGQGCSGLDVMVQQNEALYRAKGVSGELCAVRGACMRDLLVMQPTATVAEMQAVVQSYLDILSKEQADSIDLKRGMVYPLQQQLSVPWMQTFLQLDPVEYLPRVKCPMLALNGSKDCQVTATPNLDRVRELTNHRATCVELADLNHLFQHCNTGGAAEYVQIEETIAVEAMEAVAEWILNLQK